MAKKKDNLRRGKRGPVPRFDYHVIFDGEIKDIHQFITNVKEVLFLAWDNGFKMDSHLLNKGILTDGQAVFRRRDGSLMVVVRTPKHTLDEMVELYITGTEADRDYVDGYLAINPSLRRKVNPQVKLQSGGEFKLRPAKELEEARKDIANLHIEEVEAAKEWTQDMLSKLQKR